ncbi:phage head-tail adapter protein [Dehalococcoides mccartyi]|uniref:head-tail adaptor protein n=1 Tax=Dehalococcoides mccartyi TaxID=61435 RepID=UPI00098EAF28|nr:head-tail adaptor protein [Dehalococcoides mccartyi]AQU05403.1 phage head-tail adapter protein [Dehalococcoides mccartyi]AQU06855.1 phage head-tail adapter protein [Dehalococcoides mccartyi]AQW61949.1 phage head-tail adapter protein [Dehalococcoides mccartyi]
MSFGKMNTFIDITAKTTVKDAEGFMTESDTVVASVRAYREGRHGTEKWANRAAFSEASDLFCFRCIPGVTVTTAMVVVNDGDRFEITSVEDVKGRGMYIEVLAKEVKPSG